MANPFIIAEELPYTLLSLPQYAKYLGVNPVHFQGAVGENVFPIGSNACNDVWPRHSWQASDRISHEDLAYAIQDAEYEIAQILGYFPAPFWIAQEVHPYIHYYRPDQTRYSSYDTAGKKVGLQTRFGKVIEAGQRATTFIGTASTNGGSLTYSDADGDGFYERATVELSTDETQVCELKVYFAGTSADQRWEIRPERSKSISGGVVTFIFPSWLFIDPDVQSTYPTTEGFSAIDLSTTDNFVTSVDVYREYNDPTANSVTFFWEPDQSVLTCSFCGGTGCAACTLTTQDGCIHIRDAESGVVVPTPATYSDGSWTGNCYSVCRDPDEISIYYYAGALDNMNLAGNQCRELPHRLARAIAWLATARLERPFCGCNVVTALYQKLQRDMALSGEESFQLGEDIINNPFGTKFGEVQAWRWIQNTTQHILKGYAV